MSVIDAETGNIMFHEGASDDTGRGVMANVGAGGYYQIWSAKTLQDSQTAALISQLPLHLQAEIHLQ